MFPLYLAPMEDVTDPAFRRLCKRFGADRVYSEFVSCDALVRNVNRTVQKLTIHDDERPVAIQIYGREPESMAEAARIVEEAQPDFIDINFGCPVKKVAGKGAGAGLLNDVPKLLEITKAVVKAVKIPVTVKTRLGWDDDHKIITSLAEQLQDCGIAELAIHGRTRSQMYKGDADWTLIGEVKRNPKIHIPIIGNGDVTTPQRAKQCFEQYGVDAIMIGRATYGQPWIFSDIKHYLITGELPKQRPLKEQIAILKEHVLAAIQWLGDERKGIVHSRRHLAASPTFKGIPNFRDTRIRMLQTNELSELFGIMDDVAEKQFE
ncbi:MAG TPA: tRNA dihydrouridine synthase DusB [Bacteroidales bacterium]|nr:tRNA dihydrouridine synthase DusB [Bacteroidales bacterium]